MTQKRLFAVFVAALFVAAAGLPAATAAPTTQSADLAIEQPSYVDSRVHTTTVNGTNVYTVKGDWAGINPQNFNTSNVVSYGVTAPEGKLQYEEQMGTFEFDPEGHTGTFDMYWVVQRPTVVEVAQNNTTVTKVVDQRVRYEATIRVKGMAKMEHYQAGALAETKQKANLWEEYNSTVQEIRNQDLLFWFGGAPSVQTISQTSLNMYVSVFGPVYSFLNGSGILLALILSGFGLAFLGSHYGVFSLVVYRLKKQLNKFRAIEAEEGDVGTKANEVARRERNRTFINRDWNDYFNDFISRIFRESWDADTPAEAFEVLSNGALNPATWMANRLQMMHHAGYRLAVPRDVSDADVWDLSPEKTHIIRPNEQVADDEKVVGLDANMEELLEIVDWNDEAIWNDFNPVAVAEQIDRGELDSVPMTYDLEQLLETSGLAYDRFDSTERAGQALLEYAEAVVESDLTDASGRIDDTAMTLTHLGNFASKVADYDGMPVAKAHHETIEAALYLHDPNARAEERVTEVRNGSHA